MLEVERLSIETPSPTSGDHLKVNMQFRSLLLHEPIPKEGAGYIHLQGAFEPKQKKKKEADAAPDPAHQYYWTDSNLLERALMEVLSLRYQSINLPYPVQSIEVLDPTPPFTRIRLTYPSPLHALKTQMAWRSRNISPSQLFPSQDNALFGSRACQASAITTAPLPLQSWERSSPPKFRRFLHDHNDSEERSKTRFVFVTGLLEGANNNEQYTTTFWNNQFDAQESIRRTFNLFDSTGVGVEVFLSKKQQLAQTCHVGMRSPKDAQRVVKELQDRVVTWESNGERISSGSLFLDYTAVTQKSIAKSKARAAGQELEKGEVSRPECTSTTESVQIPGLVVIEDFLSIEQERILMAVLAGPQAPWAPNQLNKSQTGSISRKVQHYGYVFDYETANVLRDRSQAGANCPPMPALQDSAGPASGDRVENGWGVLAGVVEKTRKYKFDTDESVQSKKLLNFPELNQLTVNQYKVGEGIGSHVDTPSAFGDGLISISLNSGIVMEFRKVDNSSKKQVYLPPRSLVLMSGAARYEWAHNIITRRTDTHNGIVLPRSLRLSLTLRSALSEEGTALPLIESSDFPPTWGSQKATSGALVTPATERDHVHAVYDAIATQWHHTRGKRGVLWPGATQFLQRLEPGSVVADVGCGDGKYFTAVWEAGSYVIGTDISAPLLQTAFTKNENTPDARKVSPHREALRDRPAVAVADCMSVPLRSKSCDAAICIAVMHHLSTKERRIRCIEELVRVVRVGGMINIQAWAIEQQENSRRRFAAPDVFVPFNAQPKYLDKVDSFGENGKSAGNNSVDGEKGKSVAEMYSEAYTNADFDEKKGLVVFQRYCHLYRKGEMEEIVDQIVGAKLVGSGYESGNHFVILEVTE